MALFKFTNISDTGEKYIAWDMGLEWLGLCHY